MSSSNVPTSHWCPGRRRPGGGDTSRYSRPSRGVVREANIAAVHAGGAPNSSSARRRYADARPGVPAPHRTQRREHANRPGPAHLWSRRKHGRRPARQPLAEELGYDSLWTGDRILALAAPSAPYPVGDGIMPRIYENHLDPLISLALAAAHTNRVRLGTSTLNGLWEPPLMLARSLTALDLLSGGRLDVGLGLGWMPDEYTAVGVPWQGRGARIDETLDVLEEYWARDLVSHQGPLFTIPETTVGLKPHQRAAPPILLAGFTPTGLRRVARRAAGWLPVAMPLACPPACGPPSSKRQKTRVETPPPCA
ncbi:TIGR03619 family F420-dependent LLM class oxidoreductase [Streptomyces sp. 900116325]